MNPLTDQERVGLRRLLDCGAISERGGIPTQQRYEGLVKRSWASAEQIGDRRWLMRLTPTGRKKEKVLRIMAKDL